MIRTGHTAELARYDLVDAAFAATRTAADRRLESLCNDYRVALDPPVTLPESQWRGFRAHRITVLHVLGSALAPCKEPK